MNQIISLEALGVRMSDGYVRVEDPTTVAVSTVPGFVVVYAHGHAAISPPMARLLAAALVAAAELAAAELPAARSPG